MATSTTLEPGIGTRCVLPDAVPGVTFDGEGVCGLCRAPASGGGATEASAVCAE